MSRAVIGLLLLSSVVQVASAATINLESAILNAGFETSTSFAVTAGLAEGTSPSQSWNLSAPDWVVSGTAGDYRSQAGTHIGDAAFIDPLEGLNVGFITPGSYMYQDLSLTLQSNTDYVLSYAVGRRYDSLPSNYRVVVTAGGGTFVEGQNMWTYSGNTGTIALGSWATAALSFNSGTSTAANAPMRVWLFNDGGGMSITATGVGGQVLFDLTNGGGIPEPASVLLVGAGLVGIAFARRRMA